MVPIKTEASSVVVFCYFIYLLVLEFLTKEGKSSSWLLVVRIRSVSQNSRQLKNAK